MKIQPQDALLALFSLFCFKFLALSGSWQEVALASTVAMLSGFYYFTSLKVKEDNIINRLDKQEQELKDLRTSMSTLKLTQTFKPINTQNPRI